MRSLLKKTGKFYWLLLGSSTIGYNKVKAEVTKVFTNCK